MITRDDFKDCPICDTCNTLAIWKESFGWCHVTGEHPFGVPPHLDISGHEITVVRWLDESMEDECD